MSKLCRVVLNAKLLARAKAFAFAHSCVDRILPNLMSVCNDWKDRRIWRPDGNCGVISEDFYNSINLCLKDNMLPVGGCSLLGADLHVIPNIRNDWVLRVTLNTCYDLDGVRESSLYKFNIAFLRDGVLFDVCVDTNGGWCPVVDGVLDEVALSDAVLNYNNLIDDLLRIEGLARSEFRNFEHLIS